jgi:2-keto-4-pentenoate hydratase/2-oxohepta-3-ene-1,7-dioic acid hydratase in catechol pathway
MSYRHQWYPGSMLVAEQGELALPVGKLVCVGRNYAAHARELGNEIPALPIIFLKPSTAAVALEPALTLPMGRGECHYETEITLLIGQRLSAYGDMTGANSAGGQAASQRVALDNSGEVTAEQAHAAIVGIGLGLDLTLRDLQNTLKASGQPWELAKAFDAAAPLSEFLPVSACADLTALEFSLTVNGERRQTGDSADMITAMIALLQFITRYITLLPGDVVMTGTPAGVAALHSGDALTLQLANLATWKTQVV